MQRKKERCAAKQAEEARAVERERGLIKKKVDARVEELVDEEEAKKKA